MFGEVTHGIRFDTVHRLIKIDPERIQIRREIRAGEAGFASGGQGQRKKLPVKTERKPGPNEPCPCGSGKKYKYCCSGKNS
jgi:preprotein translocase subunit SecA